MSKSILLALATTLALAIPAGAAECVPRTSSPEVTLVVPDWSTIYIDNDLCQLPPSGVSDPDALVDWFVPGGSWYGGSNGGCIFSIWIYEESNGIPGLQRGDEVVDDTCGGMITSDSLAFY